LADGRDVRARLVRIRHLGVGTRSHLLRAARFGIAREHARWQHRCVVGTPEGAAVVRGADAMTTELPAVSDADLDRARTELEELVRIPSISADPAHADDVRASADAVVALMEDAGLDDVRQLVVDGGPPYVVGEWVHADDAPTVLLYAHHDVQPPGYVSRWTSDPFEPRESGGRLFGRGTADDKAGVVA